MRKYFLILAAVCLVFPVQAQNKSDDINVVIFAPKPEHELKTVNLPSCNEKQMLAAVAAQIKEYQQANPANSIISRRKQALMLKNLKEFEEIPVAGFDNASNYEVAREVVMTKVNYRIREENMRLCRGNSDIYLLIYPEGRGFRVQILNFVVAPESGNEFSVFYAPSPVSELKASDAVESGQSESQSQVVVPDEDAAELPTTENRTDQKPEIVSDENMDGSLKSEPLTDNSESIPTIKN